MGSMHPWNNLLTLVRRYFQFSDLRCTMPEGSGPRMVQCSTNTHVYARQDICPVLHRHAPSTQTRPSAHGHALSTHGHVPSTHGHALSTQACPLHTGTPSPHTDTSPPHMDTSPPHTVAQHSYIAQLSSHDAHMQKMAGYAREQLRWFSHCASGCGSCRACGTLTCW